MQFIARMIRAAKLEPCLYEEVKTDKYATSQALVVLLLSSLAASIGAFTTPAWADWSWEGLWRCSHGIYGLL